MEEKTALGRRERKKLDTWRAIRHAALQLIAERGYANVSLDDIANAADVSRATLFNYFRSKEAILFDPDPEERDRWVAFMASRPADEAVWVSLEAFFLDYTGGYETKLRLQKQLQQDVPVRGAAGQDASARLTAFLTDWLRARLAAQGHDPEDAAFLLGVAFTAMSTAFARWNLNQDFAVFHDLIHRGFARVGRGLLTSP
ncbi:TetR/AcrR family transcriptional regulator [Deinococcus yavapaiensis]|uniref:TetR family transcriptional regulator n=1 Tax=Deinococcus yavapaiensis KR-236 TaxID=694435 RepID=A0A318S386_9DEIO|nr:TetR/AcrR family transcriptional regulator [Deinococcus yavapaiensis]PYE50479.1 TetR family transcriptional regulator [Deinococcus yavapaiensis KR-236]